MTQQEIAGSGLGFEITDELALDTPVYKAHFQTPTNRYYVHLLKWPNSQGEWQLVVRKHLLVIPSNDDPPKKRTDDPIEEKQHLIDSVDKLKELMTHYTHNAVQTKDKDVS